MPRHHPPELRQRAVSCPVAGGACGAGPLRREKRVLEMEIEILKRASAPTSLGRTSSQNDLRLHRRALRRSAGRAVLSGDEGVAVGVLRLAPPAGEPDGADARRRASSASWSPRSTIRRSAPTASRRVTAELRLGLGREVNHKRVERLMRERGLQGVTRRRHGKGCTRSRADDPRADDLVHRQFRPDGPDRLWVQDVTQHRTGEGWVYLAVVIDAWSRRVVGWSIADHMRTELVVDAIGHGPPRADDPPGHNRALRPRTELHAAGCSDNGSATPGCSARWAPSATPSTTPSPPTGLRSGPPWCRLGSDGTCAAPGASGQGGRPRRRR